MFELAALTESPAGTNRPQDSRHDDAMKSAAIAFYTAVANEKNFDKASAYLGPRYIQHSPMAPDGVEGLRQTVAFLKANLPAFHVDIRRSFVDGQYVILHSLIKSAPEDKGSIAVDILRFEDGKIVEHWDVVDPLPKTSKNQTPPV